MADDDSAHVWNFAFGSNLHPDKRAKRADMTVLESAPGVLEGWRLTFNLPGLRIIEPAMAGVERAEGDEVHGLLLRMSRDDFARLIRSEGGDKFYKRSPCTVRAYDGRVIDAVVFQARDDIALDHERPPSARYLGLIREGARRSGLDPAYCARLDALECVDRGPLAAWLGERFIEGANRMARWGLQEETGRILHIVRRLEQTLPESAADVAQWVVVMPLCVLGALGWATRNSARLG